VATIEPPTSFASASGCTPFTSGFVAFAVRIFGWPLFAVVDQPSYRWLMRREIVETIESFRRVCDEFKEVRAQVRRTVTRVQRARARRERDQQALVRRTEATASSSPAA
jgi:hypothetical protein